MRTLLAYGHKRAVRTAAAAILALAAAGYSASTALAADSPLSAAAQSKIVDTGSSWTSAFSTAGAKKPVIVEFTMPALPDMPATASEGDRDKAHVAAVRAVQEKILAGVLGGNGASAISAAQASDDVNLKLMPYSPQFAMNVSADELEKIAADPSVVKIYEDEAVPPLLDQSVPLIGMGNAYAQGATGAGYRVAVLDTGARRGHEFLSTRVTNEACFNTTNTSQQSVSRCPGGVASSTATGAGEDCNSTPIYGCGHGTHVSGTAAGFNTNRQSGEPANGVARDGRILAINVFSQFAQSACGAIPSGYTGCVLAYTSDQIAALNYVNSVRSTLNIASVNMSLGSGQYFSACDSSASQTSIINTLRANNVAVVIAAGNDGYDSSVGSPGCISSAITVASSTKSDVRSNFSNWGSLIDVVAPGSSINASYTNNGNIGYASLNGTSMATPHVAGVWAALRSRVPNATVSQIENALKSTGLNITSVGTTKPRVRVDLALAQLTGTPPPVSNDNFANRTAITPATTAGGTVNVIGNNAGFTRETGEPNHWTNSAGYHSAWWRFTPASSGNVTISTAGSSFDTVLSVYTGSSLTALNRVAFNDDFGGTSQSSVTFAATAGTQYQIAVASYYDGTTGSISLGVTGGGGSVTPTSARLVAAITPVARRGVVGGSAITAFATVISPADSTTTATNCTIAKPAGSQPYNFAYAERLLPSSNLGTTNASFSLSPGQARHFLLAFSPTAAMSANLLMVFDCANTDPAPTSLGLNSFNLVATTTAGADILATAVTATNDGILRVPATSGGGNAAAMAALNIGTTASVNARISSVAIGSSASPLPVGLLLCQTNPSTGACLATPTASPIAFTATANQVYTFGAFVNYQGTALPLDPATRRVYIHFDQGGTSVGSASVAVTTQAGDQAAVKAAALD